MQDSDIYKQAMAYAQGCASVSGYKINVGFNEGFMAGYEFFRAIMLNGPSDKFIHEYRMLNRDIDLDYIASKIRNIIMDFQDDKEKR